MRLRSSVVAAVKAPPPEEILTPTSRQPDSFDFLALPEEIRMCVYCLCLISKDDISLDEGHNAYYLPSHSNGTPPRPAASGAHRYPRTDRIIRTAKWASFLSPPTGSYLGMIFNQPTSRLPARVFVGPVHTDRFSYLAPCKYTPFVGFNARILQTCKTVHAEALPILYSKNRFVLHSAIGRRHTFKGFASRPWTHLVDLRLEILDLIDLNSILNAGGSNSLWSMILRQCRQLRMLRLSFPDDYSFQWFNYVVAVIRVAANMADVKKGTGEPKMIMRAILEDFSASANMLFLAGRTAYIQHIMAKKTHTKMQVPRGPTVELVGKVSKELLLLVQGYTRKRWCFVKKSPENDCEVQLGTWVELEWIRA